ncbi:hypothetical protein TNCV_4595501 [Trichonephila clavipes]|uniref:Uncharacterized protein n=1 Tax=Trichonephila clavipes TaxID=2585209 RepID=A0A8X7BJ97_TRICX|nr:hypothetical protein TNCV_4595501 [Trichonephila clavipes]
MVVIKARHGNGVKSNSGDSADFFFLVGPPPQKSRIKAGHGNGVKSNSGDSAEFFLVGPPKKSRIKGGALIVILSATLVKFFGQPRFFFSECHWVFEFFGMSTWCGGIADLWPVSTLRDARQFFFPLGVRFFPPCFLFLRYGAVAVRLETHKFFGLKLLEEDRALLLGEFGNVGIGLGVNFFCCCFTTCKELDKFELWGFRRIFEKVI